MRRPVQQSPVHHLRKLPLGGVQRAQQIGARLGAVEVEGSEEIARVLMDAGGQVAPRARPDLLGQRALLRAAMAQADWARARR